MSRLRTYSSAYQVYSFDLTCYVQRTHFNLFPRVCSSILVDLAMSTFSIALSSSVERVIMCLSFLSCKASSILLLIFSSTIFPFKHYRTESGLSIATFLLFRKEQYHVQAYSRQSASMGEGFVCWCRTVHVRDHLLRHVCCEFPSAFRVPTGITTTRILSENQFLPCVQPQWSRRNLSLSIKTNYQYWRSIIDLTNGL